jgi:hypothetical protein
VLPTRIIKPRDKAKVEVAVQIVERFVLAKLRNRTFFSLAELNVAIRDCVATINGKVMRRMGRSRRTGLSYRDRRSLLFGTVEIDPRGRRGALHQRDRRDLP